MMKITVLITALLVGVISMGLQAEAVTDVQNAYRTDGAGPFSFDRGERLWKNQLYEQRQCADCHGADLSQPGRSKRTNEHIEAMVSSASPERYTDSSKVEKWFLSNCKWTWGRECTAQEKGDLLEYLRRL